MTSVTMEFRRLPTTARAAVAVSGLLLLLSAAMPTAASAAVPRDPEKAAAAMEGPCAWRGAHPEVGVPDGGNAVRHAQCLLNLWGYRLTVDGEFGSQTRSAVVSHQNYCGVDADGRIGPVTWRQLHSDTANASCWWR